MISDKKFSRRWRSANDRVPGDTRQKRMAEKKNLHINPKRHKDGKFQWQYKEYEEQIYMGMAVQPSLFMLKKDKFKLDVV